MINQLDSEKQINIKKKALTIYPYSLSYNLLKEALLKTGIRFNLTNSLKKADLVIAAADFLPLSNLVQSANTCLSFVMLFYNPFL